jgi:hypothetical protein
MSRWSKGFFGLLAASLMLGAVHLEIASGSDLKAGNRGDASLFSSRGVRTQRLAMAETVNREAKADRISGSRPGVSGPTIVFKLAGLKNTSVAAFLPQPTSSGSGSGPVSRAIMKTTACEPPVSALAEAARLMETGRCVT